MSTLYLTFGVPMFIGFFYRKLEIYESCFLLRLIKIRSRLNMDLFEPEFYLSPFLTWPEIKIMFEKETY